MRREAIVPSGSLDPVVETVTGRGTKPAVGVTESIATGGSFAGGVTLATVIATVDLKVLLARSTHCTVTLCAPTVSTREVLMLAAEPCAFFTPSTYTCVM